MTLIAFVALHKVWFVAALTPLGWFVQCRHGDDAGAKAERRLVGDVTWLYRFLQVVAANFHKRDGSAPLGGG